MIYPVVVELAADGIASRPYAAADARNTLVSSSRSCANVTTVTSLEPPTAHPASAPLIGPGVPGRGDQQRVSPPLHTDNQSVHLTGHPDGARTHRRRGRPTVRQHPGQRTGLPNPLTPDERAHHRRRR